MHNHNHNHYHGIEVHNSLNKAFITGIVLNTFFIILEMATGFIFNSLSLISDAWHNISDVAGLFIAFIGLKLTHRKPTKRFTYGLKKASILAAMINSFLLVFAVGIISYDAILRLINPPEVSGKVIFWVALAGIVINSVSAFFLLKHKDKDLNVKAAFWHLVADALVSFGVVISGILILLTKYYVIDALISIMISIVVLMASWKLLKESVLMNIDAVPSKIDFDKIKNNLLKINKIKDVHHIHIWPLSTTETAFTAHIVIDKNTNQVELKKQIKQTLKKSGINHVTIEFENENENCEDECI